MKLRTLNFRVRCKRTWIISIRQAKLQTHEINLRKVYLENVREQLQQYRHMQKIFLAGRQQNEQFNQQEGVSQAGRRYSQPRHQQVK